MSESGATGGFGRDYAKTFSANLRKSLGLDAIISSQRSAVSSLTTPIMGSQWLIDTSWVNVTQPIGAQLAAASIASWIPEPKLLGQSWMAAITPDIARMTGGMPSAVLESIKPAITHMIPEGVLPNVTIGANIARTVASSVDFSWLFKDLPTGLPVGAAIAIQNIMPFIDHLTDEDLEELVEETWSSHPDLVDEVESDPEYVKLTAYQKLAMKVAAALAFIFVALISSAAISKNSDMSELWEIIERAGGIGSFGVVVYHYAKKRYSGPIHLKTMGNEDDG